MAIFNGVDISDRLSEVRSLIKSKINSYDYRQLKEFSSDDIKAIAEKYRLDNVLIDFDNPKIELKNGKGEVPNDYYLTDDDSGPNYVDGKIVIFACSVSGDCSLLKASLNEQVPFDMWNYSDDNYIGMDIEKCSFNNNYVLKFHIFIPDVEFDGKSKEEIKLLVDNKRKLYIRTTLLKLDRLNKIINDFNKGLLKDVEDFIKNKIKKDSTFELISDAIGVEVKPRISNQNPGSKIEILPKKADILLPERKKYEGYYLDKNNYSAIISTIRNHLVATENNPKAIIKLANEELIRDTILWALNSNYIVATGEAFRNSGKTDIIVSFKDKSVFVAECKVWKGSQYLIEGIDQLLSYTTWRDSKMAMIVFNLGVKDFSLVCSEVEQCFINHTLFKRIVSKQDNSGFECEFCDPNNEGSTITIAVLSANYVSR